jgi:apolipoprotein N-acyltransferase
MPLTTPTRRLTARDTVLRLWAMTLGGLVLGLGQPNDLLPWGWGHVPSPLIAWLGLIPLFWGLCTLAPRPARWGMWLGSAVFFLIYLPWVRLFGPGALGYLIWVLLALAFSLLPVLALRLAQAMPAWPGMHVVGFALAWTGVEWLRGQGIFGFPLAELGASQATGLFARIASVGGTPLITFLMLLLVGSLVQHVVDARAPRWLAPAALAGTLLLLALGVWQTEAAAARWAASPARLRVALVQPCVVKGLRASDLSLQRTADQWRQIFIHRAQVMTALSATAVRMPSPDPTLVIWPESALPSPPYDLPIFDFLNATGSTLLVGAPYWDPQLHPYNAAYLMTARDPYSQHYAKRHLVPFGEFVPFRTLVNTLHFDIRGDDLQPGPSVAPLRVADQPVGVGICFESTFAGIARDYARRGARMLVYITNDAWFLQTAAIWQHFDQSRFRAMETGLPVARTASTGISAVLTPNGQVLGALPVDVTGASTLSVPMGTPGTLCTAFGWLVGPGCLVVAVLLGVVGMVGRRRRKNVGEKLE